MEKARNGGGVTSADESERVSAEEKIRMESLGPRSGGAAAGTANV